MCTLGVQCWLALQVCNYGDSLSTPGRRFAVPQCPSPSNTSPIAPVCHQACINAWALGIQRPRPDPDTQRQGSESLAQPGSARLGAVGLPDVMGGEWKLGGLEGVLPRLKMLGVPLREVGGGRQVEGDSCGQ